MHMKEVVKIAPRYTRSVNLDRDLGDGKALHGYILTGTAGEVLQRIIRALADPSGRRAWTLTGPYGSGKSAFALFLANLLGPTFLDSSGIARRLLKEHGGDLHHEFSKCRSIAGRCLVTLTGAQEPIVPALLKACARDFAPYLRRASDGSAMGELLRLSKQALAGAQIPSTRAVEVIERVSRQLRDSGKASGTLIVIDELGKFLEFAAATPDVGDMFVLQQLVEAASPRAGNDIAVITVLHQAFERYASALRPSVRSEWAKIQGRFEDVAFQEGSDQLIDLVAAAIRQAEHPFMKAMRAQAREQAEKLFELGLAPRGTVKAAFLRTLERCAPLHPLTVLAVTRMCRKFGQNHRSLFSFLASREPYAFGEFLDRETGTHPLPQYTVADLYDYVNESFADGMSFGEAGARWAAAQSSIDRAVDCTAPEIRLLKTVGLLSAVGAGELRPRPALLRIALDVKPQDRFPTLTALVKRSFLIERRYNDTVGLWDGSDVDIDERLGEAARQIPETTATAAKVSSLWTPSPIIAKRHSYRTGTLRYFAVAFADVATLTSSLAVPRDADGLLVYCIPAAEHERDTLAALATGYSTDHPNIIFALPANTEALRDAIRQLELLRWVEANTAELQSDVVAKRELRSRTSWATAQLSAELRNLFQPGETVGRRTVWFWRGESRTVSTPRGFSSLLSDVCDVVYSATPILRNELINRRSLSSAAAAARRSLLSAMIQHGGQPRLGFIGHPPELSMYVSVLEEPGLHRNCGETYAFLPPNHNSSMAAVWGSVDEFLRDCEACKRPVMELFDRLQAPPFGLKMGMLPVVLCAALLAYDAEIAIYEDGIFTPELTVEAVERLLRAPQKFELRRYRIEGVRREVFYGMAAALGASVSPTEHANLVEVMRPLYKVFNRLPPYARQTKQLGRVPIAVRQVLADAREPDVLLFRDLPQACGFKPFVGDDKDPTALQAFIRTCHRSIVELQGAYKALVTDIHETLTSAMGVSGPRGRESLRMQARSVLDRAAEPRLRAFANNLADDQLDDTHWIEAIATMVVGKVPKVWSDQDRARYELAITDLARSFQTLWLLIREQSSCSQQLGFEPVVMRVGVSDLHSGANEAVIAVLPQEHDRVAEAVRVIETALDDISSETSANVAVSALGTVLKKYLIELQGQPANSIRPAMAGGEL